jgi:hypothetical protein
LLPDRRGGGFWSRAAVAVGLLAGAGAAAPGLAADRVTAAAVWRPDAGFMGRFHRQCDGRSGAAINACFAAAMAKAGASPAALNFTRRLDSEAYLQALDDSGGPVAVAHVSYPFRANENDAWLLVNGAPALIDVDDRRYLAFAAMRGTAAYVELHRRYPNVSFWPGDRGVAGPQVARGGREFVVGYLLRDQCHACATVGRVRFAFDFEAEGKFLGTRLISVIAAE